MMKGHNLTGPASSTSPHLAAVSAFASPALWSLLVPFLALGAVPRPPPVPISSPVPRAPHSVLPKAGCSSGCIHQLCGVPLLVELGAAAVQKKELLVLLCELEAAPVLEALIKWS